MKHSRAPHGSVAWGALTALGCLLASTPSLAATLSAEAAADLEIETYVEGLASPTDLAVLPDGRVVVTERTGGVFIKPVGEGELAEAQVEVNSTHGEQGLLGVVADPGFATNQFIYFYASAVGTNAENRHQVQRYKLGADGELSEKTIVVEMGLRGPANHNGGGIDIYQGNLYIGVGDTGANSRTPSNKFSSCLNIANGKVLRVSLAEATLGQPPADNPLMNEAMVTGCDSTNGEFGMRAPEKRIFAWGFRNPFRLWVDRTSGKVWVGDVGEETKEEVGIIGKGQHAGYPFWEGTTEYNQAFKPANGGCMGMTPATACVAPITDWPRASRGTAIGGRILDGCDWPAAWKSRYVFGDHEQGVVWSIDVNATRDGMVANSRKDFAATEEIRAIKMGTDNALYLVEGVGTVSRITAKNAPSEPGSCEAVDGGGNPPGGGGGGGAGGGASGSGNAAGSGNSAAGSGAGGAPGSAGSNSGAGSPSAAGNPSSAGANSGTAGGGGAGGGGGSSDDGCGCRIAGGSSSSLFGLGALIALAGLAFRRRRG